MEHRPTGTKRVLIIISTTVLAVVLSLASAGEATGEAGATTTYRVRPGDTLWEIAAVHADDSVDVREMVEAIRRINDLDAPVLQVGQRLEIPIAEG